MSRCPGRHPARGTGPRLSGWRLSGLLLLLLAPVLLSGCISTLLGRGDAPGEEESLLRQRLAPPEPVMVKVRSKALNLRACPGEKCRILAVLRAGSMLEELERQGGWSRVRIPSGVLEGWVANAHLEGSGAPPAPPMGHGPPLPPEELAR